MIRNWASRNWQNYMKLQSSLKGLRVEYTRKNKKGESIAAIRTIHGLAKKGDGLALPMDRCPIFPGRIFGPGPKDLKFFVEPPSQLPTIPSHGGVPNNRQ